MCTRRSRIARPYCPMSRRWVSMSSTSRRSTRSAGSGARAATIRWSRVRATSAARGRSARWKADTARCIRSSERWRIFASSSRAPARHGLEVALDIAFQCAPDHPWVTEHPEWFPLASRRHGAIRRKSAEEISGHLSVQLRIRALAGFVERAGGRVLVLDRRRRAHFPRRQSAHQAVCVLGMADRASAPRPSRRHFPGRGVHPAENHASAGQARLHAVVHLFHLAQHQAGVDRVFHRADARIRAANTFVPNCWPNTPDILNEYLQIGGRPAFMARVVLCGDAVRQLRHLRTRLRADGAHSARGRERGISRFGKVSAPALGPVARRQPRRFHRPDQPGAARQSGVAAGLEPALFRGRQRATDLLRQDQRRSRQHRRGGRQSGSGAHAIRAGSTSIWPHSAWKTTAPIRCTTC